MLGYVKADKQNLTIGDYEIYRGIYCSLCKALGRNYSVFARLLLSYDFALAAVAANVRTENGVIQDIRLAFGGVAPIAFRATAVEDLLRGSKPDEALAQKAGDLAVADAIAMKNNHYKVEVLRTIVKDYVLSLV